MREFRILPLPPYRTRHVTSNLGFGLDLETNDYKVLRVAPLYKYDPRIPAEIPVEERVQIYSMSTDSWREIVAMVPKDVLLFASGKGHGKASKTHVLGDIAAMGFSGTYIQVLGGPTDLVDALDGDDDKYANLPSEEEFAEGLKPGAVPQDRVPNNKQNKGHGRVSAEEITTKKLFFLSIVYGGNSTIQRRELWSELRYIHGIIGAQIWIQLGDFNIVRSAIERSDGFDVLASTEFNDCLFDIEMDDMLMKGLWFTWSNRRSDLGENRSKLDRVLINSAWLSAFPNAEAVVLSLGISDHSPILVTVVPEGKTIRKSILKLSLAATVYGVWCKRNMRIFQQKMMEANLLSSKICNNIRDAMMAWQNIISTQENKVLFRAWGVPFPRLSSTVEV
ncbi:hypothetical protein RHMOL_Rhmol10G0074800 [Rhododendron molle]|uniref:Uncharacterized protein n=1 Tax=Rhododendron molle TaxID=49168 RepID=A0ACC0M011_RHOML|nr:hypothetical protein RHMOL_Rhmol10G0074800 [Rhododendron molle]